ncbi:MAG: hypothetical protein IPM17_07495 [Verrucomicrobia bacterium]|nr:hypothetical protein [Verrucomicrobiota bacterium]
MRNPAKTLLGALALLVVAAVIWRQYQTPERVAFSGAVRERVVALRVLAEYLSSRDAGGKVLVVANPFARQPGQGTDVYAFEDAALRGLRQGLKGTWHLVGVAHPELLPAAAKDPTSIPLPPDLTTPLSFMTSAGAWDALLRAHPVTDVWVSLIGLPVNATAMAFWREERPRLALLLPDFRVLGGARVVQDAFASGKIVAAVLHRPGAGTAPAARAQKDGDIFDHRFLLVTRTNIAAVVSAWPELF